MPTVYDLLNPDSTEVEAQRIIRVPGATVGDVLTVQADKTVAPAAGGGSQPWTPWIVWDFTDYVGADPGINGASGADGIPIDHAFAVGDVLQRLMLVVDTPLDNLAEVPIIPSIGRLAPGVYDYLDSGDTVNEVGQVYPGAVGVVAMSEPDQVAPLNVALSPEGAQSPLAIRTAGSGAVEVLSADVIVFLGVFSAPPTQGHGRIRLEVIPAP